MFHWKPGHTAAVGQVPPAVEEMFAEYPKALAAAREDAWAVRYQTGEGVPWSILSDSEFLVTFDVLH